MKLTFRWYGTDDPVTLENIRQIPDMQGIVSAIYDIPVGEVWPVAEIKALQNEIEKNGLELTVIESVPVHEDIKMGLETRDGYIENYKQTIRNLAECGIHIICYNFMPVFDWTRTDLEYRNKDNSTSLIFQESVSEKMDPLTGEMSLPGWDNSYEQNDLKRIFSIYKDIDEEKLWEHLGYFIEKIMPVAVECNTLMAIHPDDPPWNIFGLPRIMRDDKAIERFFKLYDHPNNGLTFCTGSYGAANPTKLADWIRKYGERIHFMHVRNVLVEGRDFYETAHLSSAGSVDMYEIMKALADIDFKGPLRPDHGRNIWGEKGRPGYGLYDRALGATYLSGLWEAVTKEEKK